MPTEPTLTRHYLADTSYRSLDEQQAARRSEQATGFPPVPEARAVPDRVADVPTGGSQISDTGAVPEDASGG